MHCNAKENTGILMNLVMICNISNCGEANKTMNDQKLLKENGSQKSMCLHRKKFQFHSKKIHPSHYVASTQSKNIQH